ncbi:MAG: pyruvate, phosphate dikinase [Dehalococcoidales bacterium]
MAYIVSLHDGCEDKNELGNKGGNLVTMTKIGLPVPPAFILTIGGAYRQFKKTGKLDEPAIEKAMAALEKEMKRKLGKGLEVSVRSSGPVSMPGMMDTILNIGDMKKVKTAIAQVFESWDSKRAQDYRKMYGIANDLGTSAIVQAMVYGNKDANSGTGVIFTRNANTGEKGLFGEYLARAQGEDVVSGVRTPVPVARLKTLMPAVYAELDKLTKQLEAYYHDMQDVEFTVESGKLYILQTRSGKRGGYAAVKIAVDQVAEKLITREEAVMRISVEAIRSLLHKRIQSPEKYKPLTKGLNAAPGAAGGKVVFTPDAAVEWAKKGIKVILVRQDTSPDDIHGINAAVGVLTQKGGLTSHAAIVTRAMGKACVCGAETISVNEEKKQFIVGKVVVKQGDEITVDGSTGNIYLGLLPLIEVEVVKELAELLNWCNGFKRLGVRTNADTPQMIAKAIEFGAEGVGLCRTERMFNEPDRLAIIHSYILADTAAEKNAAIKKLLVLQKKDFVTLFKTLNGLPIIIRLLDMPLHEFLPSEKDTTDPKVKQRIEDLHEVNPMLGHRGIRLAATNPELYQMQIAAIEAAIKDVPGCNVSIMLPQVIAVEEVNLVKSFFKDSHIKLGVMIETVRAAVTADKLGEAVQFFSFGTNDLTQATLSFSREDAEKKFLGPYLEQKLLKSDPFEIIDFEGVGRVMETAVFLGRRANNNLEIGICGEQGGEPNSIRFAHSIDVDYVSCSPFRVPVAKLVAAQTAIAEKNATIAELTKTRK